jgi:hypothetical protein
VIVTVGDVAVGENNKRQQDKSGHGYDPKPYSWNRQIIVRDVWAFGKKC